MADQSLDLIILNIGLLQIATELILAVEDPVETSSLSERSNWLQLMCGVLLASTAYGVLQPASNICPQASITHFNGNSINVNSNYFFTVIRLIQYKVSYSCFHKGFHQI